MPLALCCYLRPRGSSSWSSGRHSAVSLPELMAGDALSLCRASTLSTQTGCLGRWSPAHSSFCGCCLGIFMLSLCWEFSPFYSCLHCLHHRFRVGSRARKRSSRIHVSWRLTYMCSLLKSESWIDRCTQKHQSLLCKSVSCLSIRVCCSNCSN